MSLFGHETWKIEVRKKLTSSADSNQLLVHFWRCRNWLDVTSLAPKIKSKIDLAVYASIAKNQKKFSVVIVFVVVSF